MGNNLGKMSRQIASNDSMDIDNQFYNETAEHDAHDVNASQYQDLPTPQPSYIILEDGSRRCQGRNREKMCRSCGEWIDLGSSERGDAALVNHEGRNKGNLSASQPSSNTVSRNALLFSVRSHVTERVSGTLVGTAALSEIESGGITSHGLNGTWEFDLTSLETMASTLWAKATTNSEKILELGMSFNNTFPYIVNQGVSLFPCYCYVINHHQCRSSNCCYRDGQRGPGAFENNMFYLRVPTSC
jgi:hypothetical protein